MDIKIRLARSKEHYSYMYIEIIFEDGGTALSTMGPTGIKLTYNLMRQSANALFLLHKLNIAHFDIKPTNMVYDVKKDLLKIIDMGSAFGCANQKQLIDTTETLEEKVRSATLAFAPPEVLLMIKEANIHPGFSLSPAAVDVYCWAMSFFALLTNRRNGVLIKDLKKYKQETEQKYAGFVQIVDRCFESIKTKGSKEKNLKNIIRRLLTKALRFKPEERPKMEDLIHKMKKFEKKYDLKHSQEKIEHDKRLIGLYMLSDEVNSLNNVREIEEIKEEDKVKENEGLEIKDRANSETKDTNNTEEKKESEKKSIIKVENIRMRNSISGNEKIRLEKDKLKEKTNMVELICGHEVNKDYLINYVLNSFIKEKSYEYCCLCETCNKVEKLKNLPLSCRCIWTKYEEKFEFNEDLTKVSYGKCDEGHPLTSIDFGLINDFISFKFASLMISDYSKKEEELMNSFSEIIEKRGIEDIAWILKYTRIVTKLNLRWKHIEIEGAKVISEALRINSTLTKLDLTFNEIKDEGIKAIGEALKTNSTLTQLNLYCNEIKVAGTKAINELLKVNTTLKELDIGKNEIKAEGAKEIANALKTNKTLTQLDIRDNYIGIGGAEAIGEMLKVNITLTQLNISENEIRVKGMKAISEALKVNKALTHLDINGNYIGTKGAEVIYELLKANTTLKTLKISGNGIGAEGAKMISEGLKTNNILTTLDLGYNYIGDKGTETIGDMLKTNTTLKELNLYDNKIGVEGVKTISETLIINKTLTSLGIGNNSIGIKGAKIIGELLKTNNTLTTLDLSYNNIGDEGMEGIDGLLKINATLEKLDLSNNEITDKGAKVICEALKVNTTLKYLDLWHNKLGALGTERKELLKEAQKKYKHIKIFY